LQDRDNSIAFRLELTDPNTFLLGEQPKWQPL
jgi:hypothetical protein